MLPSHSCGGFLQNLHLKLLHSSTQTSAGCLPRSCVVSKVVTYSQTFKPSNSHAILVFFSYQTLWQYSDGDPQLGHRMQMGIGMSRFSTTISLYLENDTYYGTPIATRMRSIEWCHFQWPWVTPTSDLKVAIFSTSNNSITTYTFQIWYADRWVDWKWRTWKWRTIKIAGHEIAGHEKDGPNSRAWKCRTWKWRTE